MKTKILIPVIFLLGSNMVMADALNDMLNEYKQNGVSNMNEQAGKILWNKKFKDKKTGQMRSCNTCHGSDLKKPGKHAKTGKSIDPMAPSVNKKSLTEVKNIKKWFKRNCKWTLGRECTVEEQANILTYISKQ